MKISLLFMHKLRLKNAGNSRRIVVERKMLSLQRLPLIITIDRSIGYRNCTRSTSNDNKGAQHKRLE